MAGRAYSLGVTCDATNKVASVRLNSAQIIELGNNPLQIISRPKDREFIQIVGGMIIGYVGTSNFTLSGEALEFTYGPDGEAAVNSIPFIEVFNGTEDRVAALRILSPFEMPDYSVLALGIYLRLSAAGMTGGTGSMLSMDVIYRKYEIQPR